MKRRKLLKTLGLGIVAATALPAWAKGWSAESLPVVKTLSAADEKLLNQMVEALIPKTDTPGAGELVVDKYVRAMVEAHHNEAFQKKFYDQLSKVDAFSRAKGGASFADLSANQKTEVLGFMSVREDAEWKGFYGTFKRYAVQGYMGSEYVMVNLRGYVMAPGFSKGCVPV